VYSRYPEQPLVLRSGAVIGFDVVVRDCDEALGAPAWTSWGPSAQFKAFDSSLLGDLVLVEGYDAPGFVSGTITQCHDPYADHVLRVFRGDAWMGEYPTDREGRFHLMLPPGDYTVRLGEPGDEVRLYLDTFTVSSGSMVKPRLRIAMNGFSRLRHETAALFRSGGSRGD
jgi:hypothetical protein